MNILLLQPPIQDFYDTDIRLQPLGLAYLKSTIKKFYPTINVILKDYHLGFAKKTIPYPKEMKYLKNFYIGRDKGPFSSFDQYYHFGASFDYICSDIQNFSPDLIGISSLFSPYYEELITLSKEIKKTKNIPIIIGGPHATLWPDLMLSEGSIDFVIRGEGEKALIQFIHEFQNNQNFENVQNLSFKKNSLIVHNPIKDNYPINEIPIPDFDDFSPSTYQLEKRPLSFILSSRGCPYNCDFCSVNSQFGNQFHPRDVDKIIEEMLIRYHQGYRAFDFEDDNLTYNKKRSMDLFNGIIKAFPKQDIRLYAMNGISYLHLDLDLLPAMKSAGFENLNISLVSSSKQLNKFNARPFDLEKFKNIVRDAKKLEFEITAYQIIGHPEDQLDTMIETLVFLTNLPVLIGSSIFYLIKDTGIEKRFPITNNDEIKLGRLTAIYQKNYSFTQSDIFTLFISTRIINFLKSNLLKKETSHLSEILKHVSSDPRINLGVNQLKNIIHGSGYFIQNKNGARKVEKFSQDLFFKILHSIKQIITQDNQVVINDLYSSRDRL